MLLTSIFLEIRKICTRQIAHNEASMVIIATMLFPSNNAEKLRFVALYIIKTTDIIVVMYVNSFIKINFYKNTTIRLKVL